MRVLILADDLTGALDTAAQFPGKAVVLVDQDYRVEAEVVAVSSDSRYLSPPQAKKKVSAILESFPKPAHLYKKVDSTMRGNVGAELEAVKRYTGSRIPFTPAFPEQGRVIVDGNLLVDGVPLEDTQYAEDLPIRSSSIIELLKANSTLNPSFWEDGWGDVLVFRDIRSREELRQAFRSIVERGAEKVMGGSAGLAMELSRYIGLIEAEKPSSRSPILVVSGSRNKTTIEQLEELSRHIAVHEVGVKDLLGRVAEALKNGEDAAIASYLGGTLDYGKWRMLPSLVKSLTSFIGGIILVGGETTRLILTTLSAKAVRIGGSIEEGVAAGWIIGGALDGKPIVTKAGGFGRRETLLKLLRWLRQ